ncbi:hypothetical protein GCM10027199_85760 [Amycolatopsis magusensis]
MTCQRPGGFLPLSFARPTAARFGDSGGEFGFGVGEVAGTFEPPVVDHGHPGVVKAEAEVGLCGWIASVVPVVPPGFGRLRS